MCFFVHFCPSLKKMRGNTPLSLFTVQSIPNIEPIPYTIPIIAISEITPHSATSPVVQVDVFTALTCGIKTADNITTPRVALMIPATKFAIYKTPRFILL